MIHTHLKSFPKDFLWGSASAAYQVEGGWDVEGIIADFFPRAEKDFTPLGRAAAVTPIPVPRGG